MEFLSFGYLIKTKHQIWAPTSSLAIRHQEAPCCLKYINQMLCPDLSCSQFRTKKEYISLTKLWAKVYFIQDSECVNSQFLLDLKITYCIIVIALTKLTTLCNTLCNIPSTYSHCNISTNERFFFQRLKAIVQLCKYPFDLWFWAYRSSVLIDTFEENSGIRLQSPKTFASVNVWNADSKILSNCMKERQHSTKHFQ